jgi:hypothetical protein
MLHNITKLFAFFSAYLCSLLRGIIFGSRRGAERNKGEFGLLGEDKALSALSPESKVNIMGKYGRVTVNPKMSRHAKARIDIACIVAMDIAEGTRKTVFVTWHGNDVDMVGHETIGPDIHSHSPCRIGEQIKVERVIAIFEERALPPIATLGYMVRNAGKDKAREASHLKVLAMSEREVN